MAERGILFSAPMVRALLDGSKTQTRRPVKGEMLSNLGDLMHVPDWIAAEALRICPYGRPGDRLWVRETWADLAVLSDGNYKRQAIYRADDIELYGDEDEPVDVTAPDMRWRPSIHMPRWASRILLEITGVRVERLQDISDQDAIADGIEPNWCGDLTKGPNGFGGQGWVPACGWRHYLNSIDGEPAYTAIESYRTLWESINGAGNWDANPWVWVVEFKRVQS